MSAAAPTVPRDDVEPVRPSSGSRRRAGAVMQAVAVVGLLASIAGIVAGWRLLGRFESTVDESLLVTEETLVTLDRSITVAEEVVASVEESLSAAEEVLSSLSVGVAASADVVAEVRAIAETAGPSLDSAVTTLEDLARVGDSVDDVLRQLSSLPFGPDYDPRAPLGEQFARLAEDLAPVGEALGRGTDELASFGAAADDLDRRLRVFTTSVARVNERLAQSERLLAEYRTSAERALALTGGVRSDLGNDVTVSRVLLVIIGLAIAVGQVVPYWIGRELRSGVASPALVSH